jgi:hypothetical protein
MQPCSQSSGVPLGNAGDQVGAPRERQGGRKAADDGDDLPLQTKRLQSVSNRSLFIIRGLVETPARDADMPAARIVGTPDLAATQ